ncbi:MAG TPA: hypothetical protein VFR47_24220 [Anaerolineales bacterium]|nr:hypothetical protein [Anaerolineales bacterium]
MQPFFYGFTLWLGAYLLARNSQKATVRLTGWGLIAYALAIAMPILFDQFFPVILLAPALLWIGAALHLIPEENTSRLTIIHIWAVTAIPLAILTQLNGLFAVIIILELVLCAAVIAKLALHSRFKNTFSLLAVLALFVTLSTGLLILPLNWLPLSWGLPLLGLDLILLGLTITAWDAFDEGESIRAHLVRSFVSALYYAGALALLAVLFSNDETLLLLLITFGILTQTFSSPIQSLLDKLTLSQQTTDERRTLRQTAEALPLLSTLELVEGNEEQFARLTRRALSHLGDLPKLATSPLVNLSRITGTNPLDRAHTLKSLLVQSIQRLKPHSDARFGTTDEWRYYNSVYFPYVLGLKPYSRRADYDSLDEASRAALDWFQTFVPERTLHNWQMAAAKLIAEDIRKAG